MTAFDTEVQTAQQIYGTDKPILVLGLEQLEQTHPDIFAAWAAQEDYQGRPKANLAMVKRSKSFSAGAIVEGVRFPAESLKQKFQALVEAAVNRRQSLIRHLGLDRGVGGVAPNPLDLKPLAKSDSPDLAEDLAP